MEPVLACISRPKSLTSLTAQLLLAPKADRVPHLSSVSQFKAKYYTALTHIKLTLTNSNVILMLL